MGNPVIIGIVVVFLLLVISMAVKIVTEYERGVIFRLGRLVGAKGPGLFLPAPTTPPGPIGSRRSPSPWTTRSS